MIDVKNKVEKQVHLSLEQTWQLHHLATTKSLSEDELIAQALDILFKTPELLPKQNVKPILSHLQIEKFCQSHHIQRLSLFGSILRDDFGPTSDIDILVEFEPDNIPSLFEFAGMEIELTEMLGRKVDLKTPADLSHYFRQQVLATAEVQYG